MVPSIADRLVECSATSPYYVDFKLGVDGLQVSPDDLAASTYAGSPAPDGCTGGDPTAI